MGGAEEGAVATGEDGDVKASARQARPEHLDLELEEPEVGIPPGLPDLHQHHQERREPVWLHGVALPARRP
jgi:hypothetical protein